ncbi:MAG TPA: GNAT family N-acetyltransferase [Petrimonas sp.]|uniref:GNAT family N-acetyltransferase n=1 Tax=Petrimonas sp. TaxID=2023866 RepID=UPI00095B906C|nr:GNAT family N-acetyltransferase [Petrimonas sp.]OJV39145.1 MAG: GNAT family N-acetyltransferase [Bacteroidia bacterium 43-41]MEA4980584.1 GNAT family N-acetyltransferase [Petrimonas sp.]MEA5043131.1 GNAT family N-acetyltransferase [Petrimonas sp.]MEA5061771.1 GNAT family N-acetyltransferase [Petrimonas sp.]
MRIRPARHADLPRLMQIYETARRFMQQTGNAGQWVDGYPKEELIVHDIEQGHSYVCLDENNGITGTFYYIFGEEPTYLNIYEGSWLNDEPYGVIHRIASSGKQKGVAETCIRWCLEECKNIRIDTHRDNKVMQNILQKLGFTRCGIIYLENGAERLAYQRF